MPADAADSAWMDFTVTGWSMIGFPGKGWCSYSDWASILTPIAQSTEYATIADQFAWTCGYYVEYEWNGNGEIYWEINSMNAVA
jgi:hypothetical protein